MGGSLDVEEGVEVSWDVALARLCLYVTFGVGTAIHPPDDLSKVECPQPSQY